MVNLSSSGKVQNNRYLIYKMLKRKISFSNGNGRKITGTVDRICRNIFENLIEVTIDGKLFKFKEPDIISFAPSNKSMIVFMYGRASGEVEMSDQVLFAEVRASLYKGETINDVISRTTPDREKIIRFTISH